MYTNIVADLWVLPIVFLGKRGGDPKCSWDQGGERGGVGEVPQRRSALHNRPQEQH